MSDLSHKVSGFLFSAVSAGLKKEGALDLGLVISETKASAAAVFTKSHIKAAPVRVSMDRIKSGAIKGIIVNSGNANAATGDSGLEDAKSMALSASQCLNIDEDDILVASTGVIGERLDIGKVKKAIPTLCNSLGADRIEDFTKAIMTTDAFEKISSKKIMVSGKEVTVIGVAKGAGMIMPNMATMLCFVMTDAAVAYKRLKAILNECVDATFNTITVDSDTSTNDMVIIMANGESGADEIEEGTAENEAFVTAVKDVMYDLAEKIVKDGEGATKLIKIVTRGADNDKDADCVARSIANSPLVKTTFFGEDANVGRLLMAIGKADAKVYPNEIEIFIGDIPIVIKGMVNGEVSSKELDGTLKKDKIEIIVDLHVGDGEAEILTCDLSYDYVKINSEYTT